MSEDFREIDEMTNEVIVEDKDVNVTVEDDDDDYELVCMICHRPESKAGKILTMPGNLNICTDCMQKMFNTAEQFGLPEMDGFPGFVTKMEIPIQQIFIQNGEAEYRSKVAELMKLSNVAGIIGTDADSYIIGEEARRAGRKDIISAGFDLNSESSALMRDGYFKIILDQNPEQQAFQALDNVCRHLLYQTKVKNIYTDVIIVTSEVLRYKEK